MKSLTNKYHEIDNNGLSKTENGRIGSIKNTQIKTIDYNNKDIVKTRTRAPFNPVEDFQLIQLVKQFGNENKHTWHLIANQMKGRSARQCRERYQLYLTDKIKKNKKWEKEEDEILLSKYSILGPKWKKMEEYLKGRNSYSIKNRFISLSRKMKKELLYNSNEQFNNIVSQNEQNGSNGNYDLNTLWSEEFDEFNKYYQDLYNFNNNNVFDEFNEDGLFSNLD